VLRTHAAVVRLREGIAQVESIPHEQRTENEALRWRVQTEELKYFENEAMPNELILFAVLSMLLPTGLGFCLVGWLLRRGQSPTRGLQ
jgi:hypothetical protein